MKGLEVYYQSNCYGHNIVGMSIKLMSNNYETMVNIILSMKKHIQRKTRNKNKPIEKNIINHKFLVWLTN